MSYYTMAFVGMAPFGSLLAGALAHRYGAPHTVMITGSVCVLGGVWFATQLRSVRKVMKPIYQQRWESFREQSKPPPQPSRRCQGISLL